MTRTDTDLDQLLRLTKQSCKLVYTNGQFIFDISVMATRTGLILSPSAVASEDGIRRKSLFSDSAAEWMTQSTIHVELQKQRPKIRGGHWSRYKSRPMSHTCGTGYGLGGFVSLFG